MFLSSSSQRESTDITITHKLKFKTVSRKPKTIGLKGLMDIVVHASPLAFDKNLNTLRLKISMLRNLKESFTQIQDIITAKLDELKRREELGDDEIEEEIKELNNYIASLTITLSQFNFFYQAMIDWKREVFYRPIPVEIVDQIDDLEFELTSLSNLKRALIDQVTKSLKEIQDLNL